MAHTPTAVCPASADERKEREIELSLLARQPPGTVIKRTTAHVLQSGQSGDPQNQGPRVFIQGVPLASISPPQMALLQQQAKQLIQQAKDAGNTSNVLGPIKLFVAVKRSAAQASAQASAQPAAAAAAALTGVSGRPARSPGRHKRAATSPGPAEKRRREQQTTGKCVTASVVNSSGHRRIEVRLEPGDEEQLTPQQVESVRQQVLQQLKKRMTRSSRGASAALLMSPKKFYVDGAAAATPAPPAAPAAAPGSGANKTWQRLLAPAAATRRSPRKALQQASSSASRPLAPVLQTAPRRSPRKAKMTVATTPSPSPLAEKRDGELKRPAGAAVRSVTASVLSVGQSRRILIHKDGGEALTPQQVASVQLQIMQELAHTRPIGNKSGVVLSPRKVHVAAAAKAPQVGIASASNPATASARRTPQKSHAFSEPRRSPRKAVKSLYSSCGEASSTSSVLSSKAPKATSKAPKATRKAPKAPSMDSAATTHPPTVLEWDSSYPTKTASDGVSQLRLDISSTEDLAEALRVLRDRLSRGHLRYLELRICTRMNQPAAAELARAVTGASALIQLSVLFPGRASSPGVAVPTRLQDRAVNTLRHLRYDAWDGYLPRLLAEHANSLTSVDLRGGRMSGYSPTSSGKGSAADALRLLSRCPNLQKVTLMVAPGVTRSWAPAGCLRLRWLVLGLPDRYMTAAELCSLRAELVSLLRDAHQVFHLSLRRVGEDVDTDDVVNGDASEDCAAACELAVGIVADLAASGRRHPLRSLDVEGLSGREAPLHRLLSSLSGLSRLRFLSLEALPPPRLLLDAITPGSAPSLMLLNVTRSDRSCCPHFGECSLPGLASLVRRNPQLHVRGLALGHDALSHAESSFCACCETRQHPDADSEGAAISEMLYGVHAPGYHVVCNMDGSVIWMGLAVCK